MRKVSRKVYRREGQEERLYSAITCDQCGHTVYERKVKKIQAIIDKPCPKCASTTLHKQKQVEKAHRKAFRESQKALEQAEKVASMEAHLKEAVTLRDLSEWSGESQKRVIKKVYVPLKDKPVLRTMIQCDSCGTVTYGCGEKHTQKCLSESCNTCDTLNVAQRRGILNQIYDRENLKHIHKRISDGSDNRQKTHDLASTPIYKRWSLMMSRCFDDSNPSWEDYGGRGITVCERWFDVANFYEDMGQPPAGKHIDRINNDGNYEPGNCRWVTPAENIQNRRDFRYRPERLGWWHLLGLKHNPYVYGPMPWKKTSLKHRKQEHDERIAREANCCL